MSSIFPLLPLLTLLLASCSGLKPASFTATSPPFDIVRFYTGHTKSTGLIETRGGKPLKRVATETWGHLEKDGELNMTQDITLDDGQPERRHWRIRRLDEHHYEGRTANVIGVAKGEAYGNALRLDYVIALKPSNPFSRVRMTHWMVLHPDGRTMLNSVAVRKAGLVVARIEEVFRRDSEPAVSRSRKFARTQE